MLQQQPNKPFTQIDINSISNVDNKKIKMNKEIQRINQQTIQSNILTHLSVPYQNQNNKLKNININKTNKTKSDKENKSKKISKEKNQNKENKDQETIKDKKQQKNNNNKQQNKNKSELKNRKQESRKKQQRNNKQQRSKNKQNKKDKNEQKQYRKLLKQNKRVKSLQEQYRQLQEQIKQIKQLVQLQLQLINYNTEQIYQKSININKGENIQDITNDKVDKIDNLKGIQIKQLKYCIDKLFKYNQTIQSANTNYLLLSQVNKQQQSQHIYHINNLQSRIQQLRFLLNTKQDLLAYQYATLQNNQFNTHEQFIDQSNIHKIYINYNVPKKQTLNNLNYFNTQFQFVSKVIQQMKSLKSTVKSLQSQLNQISIHQSSNNHCNQQAHLNQNNNQQSMKKQQQNQQNHSYKLKDSVKQDFYPYTTQRQTSKYSSSNQVTPKKQKIFTECQNTILSAQTARPSKKQSRNNQGKQKNMSPLIGKQRSPSKILANPPIQLTLLPLSTQNYKQSLIYRVGKLQEIQRQRSSRLDKRYKQLSEQYRRQIENKKILIKQYQLKKDIYEYKKKLMNDKSNQGVDKNIIKRIFSSEKEENGQIGNILDELEDKQQNNNNKIIQQSKIVNRFEQYVAQDIDQVNLDQMNKDINKEQKEQSINQFNQDQNKIFDNIHLKYTNYQKQQKQLEENRIYQQNIQQSNNPTNSQHQSKIIIKDQLIQTNQINIKPQDKQLQIIQLINLSSQSIPQSNTSIPKSNISNPKATSSSTQHHIIFNEITNQNQINKKFNNKRSSNNPFLKLKNNNLQRKHYSQQSTQFISKQQNTPFNHRQISNIKFNQLNEQNDDKANRKMVQIEQINKQIQQIKRQRLSRRRKQKQKRITNNQNQQNIQFKVQQSN